MDVQELLKQYEEFSMKRNAYSYANYIIGWDSETEAPKNCFEVRSKMVGVLSSESFRLETSAETKNIINTLYDNIDYLDDLMKRTIKKEKRSLDQISKIPEDEYVQYSILMAESHNIWAKAKINNDYQSFAPTLKKIIDFQKKMMKYFETDTLKGYDTLLDQYEEGANTKIYDKFFDTLKKDLVPFVLEVAKKQLKIDHPLEGKLFDVEGQKKIANYFMDVLKFNRDCGLLKESEHPFTSGFGNKEVRITTHYYEDNLLSSIFSVIHESGHATYEQQVDDSLNLKLLGGGATMAMHESQSRLYENMIGRSKVFWDVHYPKIKEQYPELLKEVTAEDFYKIANKVSCSLVRTEADELTYPLHIMLRYDLEKQLLTGSLTVDELPKAWNKAMKDYLGIDVPSDKEGVLQDIHWAMGSFGYFPTYAYGSAIAAQLYHQMDLDINVEETLKKGTTEDVNNWLKEHVHKFGGSRTPQEMIVASTKEEFNPHYYVKYLKDKYSKIYHIN